MPPGVRVVEPDLPDLEELQIEASELPVAVALEGVLVEQPGQHRVRADAIRIKESELRGVTVETERPVDFLLSDAVLRDCDLSNVAARGGTIKRTELHQSRLVGFDLSEGSAQDVRLIDCSLTLATFAFAQLRTVVFERVNLAESSFMQSVLHEVEFIDCKLDGVDFRGVRLNGCAIRGSSLDGVLGVDSLRGLTMPWEDVVGSAAAMALALGIETEAD
jgi:uncharacterized protein YjbI with pentapeptide repeats